MVICAVVLILAKDNTNSRLKPDRLEEIRRHFHQKYVFGDFYKSELAHEGAFTELCQRFHRLLTCCANRRHLKVSLLILPLLLHQLPRVPILAHYEAIVINATTVPA